MLLNTTSENGTVFDLLGPQNCDVVVLIHGLGLNRQIWEKFVPQLSAHFRILNYDLLGHGESGPPLEKPILATFSEQLIGLLDELDISKVALVGFSLGGMINRRMAIDHSDRVNSLAILNSPHQRTSEAQKLVEERALDTAQGGPAVTLHATINRWFTAEFRQSNPNYIERVRNWVLENDPILYAQCRQVLATGVIELINPNPPIIHPTLVITCENDSGSTPAMTHSIAGEIKSS